MKAIRFAMLTMVAFGSLVSAAEKDLAKSLPAPVGEKIYTFQQIEEQKLDLRDKIVRLELSKLLGKGSEEGDGLIHYIAKDTSGGATPYGQMAFPKEGLAKSGLADPNTGPVSVYVRIHLFEDKKAAALCIAVGTHVSVIDGKGVYSWEEKLATRFNNQRRSLRFLDVAGDLFFEDVERERAVF